MTPSATNLSFVSDELRAPDRLSIWREVYARNMLRIDWDHIPEQPFRCNARLTRLPGLGIASVSATRARAYRSREMTSDGNGDYFLCIPLEGTALWSVFGREIVIRDRGAYLLRASESGGLDFSSKAKLLVVAIPPGALEPIMRGHDLKAQPPIPGDTHALKLLIGYLDLLQKGHALGAPDLQHHAASHVYDLAGLAIGATRDAAHVANGRGVRAARLEAIRADILANLSQVRLSPKTVARRHGVSERYVHLLFERTGETFGEVVTKARLKRAFDLLGDSGHASTISDIAHSVGYGDLSTFNRAFRRHFGDTPSAVRNSPLQQ